MLQAACVPALLARRRRWSSTFILAPGIGILPRLGLALGAGLARRASLLPLVGRNPLRDAARDLGHGRRPSRRRGGACSAWPPNSAFTSEKLAAARPGETLEVGPWLVELRDVDAGRRAELDRARGRASRARAAAASIDPQAAERAIFTDPPTETNEAAIDTVWNGQLYTVLGEPDEQGRWQLRLWWKPFVTLIWLGGVLIALGGALALIGRLVRERRQRRRGRGGVSREPRCFASCRCWCCSLFVGAVAWRLAVPRRRPKSASQLVGQPVPAFALPPAIAGQAGPVLRRPRDRPAAPAQRLRQLVRAVHRRSAGADAS